MKTLVFTFLLLTAISSTSTYGRMVKYWCPDELTDKSSLVCDGEVLDVTVHFQSLFSDMRLYSAKIKVLTVLKGAPVDILEFHYYRYEPWLSLMIINGPMNVSLREGRKYRFYLNKDASDGIYINCLQGEVDDSQSVGPILIPGSPEESKIRLNEVMKGGDDALHLFDTALGLEGKPGYEEARASVVVKFLKLILTCESLKTAQIDHVQVKATENFYIDQLADLKDQLFQDPNDTPKFDKLINDNLADQTIRAYVIQQMIAEWDHPNR